MKALSKVALMSLLQMTSYTDIPLSVMKHWYVIHGKEMPKEEEEELERDERRVDED